MDINTIITIGQWIVGILFICLLVLEIAKQGCQKDDALKSLKLVRDILNRDPPSGQTTDAYANAMTYLNARVLNATEAINVIDARIGEKNV